MPSNLYGVYTFWLKFSSTGAMDLYYDHNILNFQMPVGYPSVILTMFKQTLSYSYEVKSTCRSRIFSYSCKITKTAYYQQSNAMLKENGGQRTSQGVGDSWTRYMIAYSSNSNSWFFSTSMGLEPIQMSTRYPHNQNLCWLQFYGISFKYSSWTVNPWLTEYFKAYPQGTPDIWPGSINPTANNMYQVEASQFSWKNLGVISDNIKLCPPGHHYNMSYADCTPCDSPCLECSVYNSSKCFTCVDNYYFFNYTCLKSDCPKGQYFSNAARICTNCVSPCTSCDDSTSCNYCVPGYKYVDNFSGKCILKATPCPAGTYDDPLGLPICRKCPLNCQVCSSTTVCTDCIDSFQLSQNGVCSPNQCLINEYFDAATSKCKACSTNCESCNKNGCQKCQNGFFLNEATRVCGKTCPAGYYANSQSNACMKCQSNCLECVTNNYTCTKCDSTTFMYNSACVTQCPYIGYYNNVLTRNCDPCNSACSVCINSVSDCVSCKPGSFYSNRKCVNSCPVREYQTQYGFCYPCDPSCDVCFGAINTMCSKCMTGYYLLDTSCLSSCPPPYYADLVSKTCEQCKYFCDSCTEKNNCQKCKSGYPTISNNCTGEYYLRTTSSQYLTLPMNPVQFTPSFDPTAITAEIWFKSDDVLSSNNEVIVGLSPYKLKKKPFTNEIQLSFQNAITYCDSGTILKSNKWYYFAFTISEAKSTLACYIYNSTNFIQLTTGTSSTMLITSNVQLPNEVSLGGTKDPRGSEQNFVGYIKEFRLWQIARTVFQLQHFKYVQFHNPLDSMLAYWRLDEINDGTVVLFKDSSQPQTLTFNPSTSTLAKSVQQMMEFREVILKICSEGFYPKYNEVTEFTECLPCNSSCKNCIAPDGNKCSDCLEPLKLLQDEMICIIVESCPDEFFQDPETGLCMKCNPFCKACVTSANFCSICKAGYFKEFQGTSCVQTCPSGMYGNYKKQLCYTLPTVDWILPADQSVYLYDTFIDVSADFSIYNNESSDTYTFGWIIMRVNGNIDITNDVVKTYYQRGIKNIHLDINVLQSNQFYDISFFVQGNNASYNGMYVVKTNNIYIGINPKNGKCLVSPLTGISGVTNFNISQNGWVDQEPIISYDYFYSYDSGKTFIPIVTGDPTLTLIKYKFGSTYDQYMDIKIKCRATNRMGFSNQVITSLTLEKKSSADALSDLINMDLSSVDTEAEILKQENQLRLITKSLGNLKEEDPLYFDPKLDPSQCTSKICRLKYIDIPEKFYEFEFLTLATSYKEMLNDQTFGLIVQVLNSKISQWEGVPQSDSDLQNYLIIASNLIEYLEYQSLINNQTKSWTNTKLINAADNKQMALDIFTQIRLNTLNNVDMLKPQKQIISRNIAYKQFMITKESLLQISATNYTKKSQSTFIKVSQLNFIDNYTYIDNNFIAEVIEFAFNPYQIINNQNIATNIFEVTFYNASDYQKADIKNLTYPLLFSFPFQDNQNVSDFMKEYNSHSPYKAAQKLKKQNLIDGSQIGCNYWNGTVWSNQGCTLEGLDTTHIKCGCNHLSSIAPQFITPELKKGGTTAIDNRYTQSDKEEQGEITKEDLQVPLEHYFKNLDRKRRYKMTKSQNRDDLAEIKDRNIQKINDVIQDIIARHHIKKEQIDNAHATQMGLIDKVKMGDAVWQEKQGIATSANDFASRKTYEEMTKEEKKELKRKASKKVFGKVGSTSERARRFYEKTLKTKKFVNLAHNEAKMKFFNQALKTNLWFGLLATTSKIAPRHIRLALMYLYISIHLLITSFAYIMGYQEMLADYLQEEMISIAATAIIPLILAWIICIPKEQKQRK
eukprot:403359155